LKTRLEIFPAFALGKALGSFEQIWEGGNRNVISGQMHIRDLLPSDSVRHRPHQPSMN
jgi:hypothetical protein